MYGENWISTSQRAEVIRDPLEIELQTIFSFAPLIGVFVTLTISNIVSEEEVCVHRRRGVE